MAIRDVIRGNAPANLAGGMPSVQTVDNTTTTLLTVEVPDKHAGIIEIAVIACRDGFTYDTLLTSHMVRRNGAAATYVGALASNVSGDTSWLLVTGIGGLPIDCTGTTLRVRVIGVVGQTFQWMGAARWVVLGQDRI
jgi:hypothetical protein